MSAEQEKAYEGGSVEPRSTTKAALELRASVKALEWGIHDTRAHGIIFDAIDAAEQRGLARGIELAARLCDEAGPRYYHKQMHEAANGLAQKIRALAPNE